MAVQTAIGLVILVVLGALPLNADSGPDAAETGEQDRHPREQEPPADVVFVHLSDTHAATATENPAPRHGLDPHRKDLVRSFDWLEAAVASINEHIEPDFVVITGDVTDGSADRPADLERVREILDELECPYHVLIGNHDRGGRAAFERVFETPANFSFEHGDWRFIALDGSRATLPETSLTFLRRELAKEPPPKGVVVMNHYPLTIPPLLAEMARMTYPGRLVVANADEVLPLLEAHDRVRLVIAGHVHRETHLERNGVLHVTTGSLIEPPHHFRVFRLRGETVEWDVHGVELSRPEESLSP